MSDRWHLFIATLVCCCDHCCDVNHRVETCVRTSAFFEIWRVIPARCSIAGLRATFVATPQFYLAAVPTIDIPVHSNAEYIKRGFLPFRKRRLEVHGPCCHCGAVSSPQWRKGPKGKPVLCNACGIRFLRTRSLGKVPVSARRSPPSAFPLGRLQMLAAALRTPSLHMSRATSALPRQHCAFAHTYGHAAPFLRSPCTCDTRPAQTSPRSHTLAPSFARHLPPSAPPAASSSVASPRCCYPARIPSAAAQISSRLSSRPWSPPGASTCLQSVRWSRQCWAPLAPWRVSWPWGSCPRAACEQEAAGI